MAIAGYFPVPNYLSNGFSIDVFRLMPLNPNPHAHWNSHALGLVKSLSRFKHLLSENASLTMQIQSSFKITNYILPLYFFLFNWVKLLYFRFSCMAWQSSISPYVTQLSVYRKWYSAANQCPQWELSNCQIFRLPSIKDRVKIKIL